MSEQPKKRSRIRASHVVAVLLAVSVTAWIGSGVVNSGEKGRENKPQETAQVKELPLVRILHSTAQTHRREIILFGRTEAIDKADIAAEIDGRITQKQVQKGDMVKKGDVLFRLSTEDRMSKLAKAKADLEYQEISYNAAQRLSKKQFQSQVKLAEVKAALEAAKASLEAIQLEIAKTVVRAPIDGVVNALPLSVGDYVKSGNVMATIVALDPLRVVAQVSERDVSRIQPDSEAVAHLPDGRVLQGKVNFISRAGSSATRTFDVDVWVDNPQGAIPEGLTTEMRLQTESEQAHLVSPAVLTLDGEGAVGIKAVNGDNVVEFYRVVIVADTAQGIWLAGLPEKLTVITVGQEFVVPGQKVRTATEAQVRSGDVQKDLTSEPESSGS